MQADAEVQSESTYTAKCSIGEEARDRTSSGSGGGAHTRCVVRGSDPGARLPFLGITSRFGRVVGVWELGRGDGVLESTPGVCGVVASKVCPSDRPRLCAGSSEGLCIYGQLRGSEWLGK